MRSSSREGIVEVLDALDADLKRALDLTSDVLTTPERLNVLERLEKFRRLLPAVEHPLINQLAEQAEPAEIGGKLAAVLADRLRISRAEASRRVHEAADLGERRALNGEPLPPVLEATAAAQRNGDLGTAACSSRNSATPLRLCWAGRLTRLRSWTTLSGPVRTC
jgi:uncharacterized protein DUF222